MTGASRCAQARGSLWSAPCRPSRARCSVATRSPCTSVPGTRACPSGFRCPRWSKLCVTTRLATRLRTRRVAPCSAADRDWSPMPPVPRRTRTSVSPCSATRQACSAQARPARVATRPTCGSRGQEELLDALLATGTPVVLVLLVGRPYDISRQADRLAAALYASFLGEEGAPALGDVLSGRVNPSGHLPVSFPSRGGSQPATYLTPALGQRSDVSSVDPTALYPFGHGLSYAPATWDEAVLLSGRLWPTDGTARVAVTLRNGADIATAETVQVYLHDPVAEVVRPTQCLIAAQRVDLAPGSGADGRLRVACRPRLLHRALRPPPGRPGSSRAQGWRVEQRHPRGSVPRTRGPRPSGRLRAGDAAGGACGPGRRRRLGLSRAVRYGAQPAS